MKKNKALYASISHDKGRYTIYYEQEENAFGIHTEGYSPDVFKGLPKNLPVIRFDKADLGDVWAWLDTYYQCAEHEGNNGSYKWKSLTLHEYLSKLSAFNIPVEKLREVKA